MMKIKLVKALALGLCMSAISTGTVFAMEVSTTSFTGTEEMSDELKVMYEKQAEIDRLLFGKYSKELEDKDIFINYTGVNGDLIEIGVSNLTDDKADYIYELVGKDQVKVVAFDESIIYASGIADPAIDPIKEDVVDSVAADKGELYDTVDAPDASITSDGEVLEGEKVYKDSDVQIQIESTDAVEDADDVIFYTTADGAEAGDIKTVAAATGVVDDVKRGEEESGVSAPMVVLAIAAGAALVGGSVVVANKKKNTK